MPGRGERRGGMTRMGKNQCIHLWENSYCAKYGFCYHCEACRYKLIRHEAETIVTIEDINDAMDKISLQASIRQEFRNALDLVLEEG